MSKLEFWNKFLFQWFCIRIARVFSGQKILIKNNQTKK